MTTYPSKNIIIVTAGYIIFFIVATCFINKFIFYGILQADNFFSFDSNHYLWIAKKGYDSNKVAFFPLFPKLWGLLNLNLIGVLLLNIALYLGSFYTLARKFNFKLKEALIYLSIPSSCFMFLPYSEALFYATSTVVVIGVKENKTKLVILGLFLSTLSRSAFTIIVPAIIITEVLTSKIDRSIIIKILVYLLVIFLAILIVAYIQFWDTRRWFEFFEVQKEWNNQLQMLHLPFTTWGGDFILKLDGAALLIGFISGLILSFFIFKRIKNTLQDTPPELVLSLSYLGGMTLFVLLFKGGSINSINRYIFAVPYFVITLHYFFRLNLNFGKKEILIGLLTMNVFWLLFASFGHILTLLKFLILSLHLLLILLIKHKNLRISNGAAIIIIGINSFIQLYLFSSFLRGEWVG